MTRPTDPGTSPDELLTLREVASYLRLTRTTVQRWCNEGRLPAVRIGKEYRIRRSDLEAWFKAQRDGRGYLRTARQGSDDP